MDIINDDPKYLNKLFDNVYSYPSITDKDFQEKIFRKKEFFNYQVQKSKDIKNYEKCLRLHLRYPTCTRIATVVPIKIPTITSVGK